MENIILMGMPSCGKSTVGVLLAKTMQMDFIDTDILIQNREGMKLQEIIEKRGQKAFFSAEEEALLSVECENTVIATGGSAVYYEDACKHFKKNGKVVYIRVSLDTILQRLDNIETRGVPLKKGETIEDLYNRRIPLYEDRADLILDADGMTPEETVTELVRLTKG